MHLDESIYPGDSLKEHVTFLKDLINETKSETLLDYGCGKGNQYFIENSHVKYFNGVMPYLYDPAVETHNTLPTNPVDGVFSTDVLEHIPEDDLDLVFTQMYSLANKFVYHGICTIPAKAILPNGENAHVTVKPKEWWVEKILPYSEKTTWIYCYGLSNSLIKIQKGKLV
jgi:cyclopropane fatty-acyl-phospholipid synthase-like methyltransferase